VRDLMRLCFLMEKTYAPYIKWLGTAFQGLGCAPDLAPVLHRILQAETWQQREAHLTTAYQYVAQMHNGLGLTAPIDPTVSPFYGRPFLVIHTERFSEALHAQIQDSEVRALPKNLGGIDQFVDSTDVLSDPQKAAKAKAMYD
jgi:hypothetical protein